MNEFVATSNLPAIFAGKVARPTITLWNRLEGRPRTHDFDRALRAEVRDALWMLTKQWQMGEFRGDDAGSPVTAKLHVDTTQLTKYKTAYDPAEAFDGEVPLEANVERRPVRLTLAGTKMAVDIRLAVGRRWLRLIAGIEPGIEEKFRGCARLRHARPRRSGRRRKCGRPSDMAAICRRSPDAPSTAACCWDAPARTRQATTRRTSSPSTMRPPRHPVEAAETELLGTLPGGSFYQPVNGGRHPPRSCRNGWNTLSPPAHRRTGPRNNFVAEGLSPRSPRLV